VRHSDVSIVANAIVKRPALALLGGFEVRLGSGAALSVPTRKAQALLAYLALPTGIAHPRDKLAALLWGDLRATPARNNLRQSLFVLRKVLTASPPGVFEFDGDNVGLNPASIDVDVCRFERAIADGSPGALADCNALYRGDLLAGLAVNEPPFEEWLLAERERLRELALEALAKLLQYQRRAASPPAAAIQTAVRLLAVDPLQEATYRVLMQLFVDCGRRDAALRQYQICADVLERELGVEPEAETKALYQEVLRRRSEPSGVSAAVAGAHSKAAYAGSGAGPRAETPLVGRQGEIARLHEALEEAWGGRGRIVALLGTAGIGKTRLVAELTDHAMEHRGRTLLGRAYENQDVLAFGPWVNALRGADLTHWPGLRRIARGWRRELARLLPELGIPGPGKGVGVLEPLNLFESIVQVVEHLADTQPLLLVLEDLQWADEMSLRLLGFLGRRLPGLPVLVVVTVREEDLVDVPLLRRTVEDLGREERLLSISLDSLSQSETLSLVRVLAGTTSEAASLVGAEAAIWVASKGNPFLIVEAVRTLREGSTIVTTTGLTLPERAREVIVRRLERLSDRGRYLVMVAAIIACEFEFKLLQQASGLSEYDAAEGVEELVRRRIFHLVGEQFEFSHDAVRTAAMQQILPPLERALHRRVAEAIESLYSRNLEGSYATLGRHFREAEVWDKAARYLRLAGAQALSRSAHRDALALLEPARKALECLDQNDECLAQAIDVRIDLYHALLPLGAPQQIAGYLAEAQRMAQTLGDPMRCGWVDAYATNALWLCGDPERAAERGRHAVGLSEMLGERGLGIVARFFLAQVHHFRGDYRQAIALLREAVTSMDEPPLNESFGLPGVPAVLLRSWLAWSLGEMGEFNEGAECGAQAVRLAEIADHAFSCADAYRALGYLHLRRGEFAAAIELLERGLALCRIRDLELWVPSIGAALGYACTLDGSLAKGTDFLELALHQADSLQIRAGQAMRSAWLGENYLRLGRIDDAMRLARQALELARTRKEQGYAAWALRLLGEIAAHPDVCEPATAEAHYSDAKTLAAALGVRPLMAHCRLGLGTLYQRANRTADARTELSSAAESFREMDMALWQVRAQAELAAVALAH
jgi:DNA-binding SARP family transcriptional activator/tetratricopeptide (TPR) repeat protein